MNTWKPKIINFKEIKCRADLNEIRDLLLPEKNHPISI
jgi:hypothetical protein